MNESILLEQVRKLSPKTGDVFVLTFEAGNQASLRAVRRLASYVRTELWALYEIDVLFVALSSDMTLREVSEAEMNAAGWFRADPCAVVEDAP